MAKRGRILSDPTAGPGRVIVQGRQHVFGLDGVWKSDALPRPGIVVDVEFDDTGRIYAMMAVPEARLAREQAEAALAFARDKGADLGSALAGRFGLMQLVALGLLVVGWFWLGTFEIDDTDPAPSFGLYRLVAIICLAAPVLACVWRDKYAHLASLLPLVATIIVISPGLELVRPGGAKTISLSAGAYLAMLASLYLALVGIKRFLVAKAHDGTEFYENE